MYKLTRLAGSAIFATGSALLVAAALPAQATPANSTTEAPAPSEKASAPAAAEKRYCMMDSTNTRVPRKICHTKAEWESLGVELDVK